MKTRKRLLSLALALCMVLTMLPGVAWAADTPTSGTCGADGDNITWTLQSDGTLLLQGSGKTEDYGGAWFRLPAPWRDLADQIYEIRVEGSITYLGSCLFEDCTSAIGITLPGTLETIRSDSLPKGESASVEYVVVSPGQGNFVEDGGVLYAKECSMTDNYVIGNLEDGKETYFIRLCIIHQQGEILPIRYWVKPKLFLLMHSVETLICAL